MRTNGLYVLTAENRGSWYPKMILVSLVIALLFASLPAANVFAAPASGQGPTIIKKDLELAWKNKLRQLRVQGFYYDNVRFYPADFDKPSDLARVHGYLEKYGFALRQANTIAFNHTGFNIEGRITNEIQADKTVRDLAMYLHIMRGLREKVEAVPGGK
jgi:hypothetical protein